MKIIRTMLLGFLTLTTLFAIAQTTPQTAAKPTSPAPSKITDFAWLAGRWTGEMKEGRVEQTWSGPETGLMMGMFRIYSPEKTVVLEFMSLRETDHGVELKFRHFSPEMEPWEKDAASTLQLVRREGDAFIFNNPVHSRPKTTTMTRKGNDSVVNRSEIIRADGTTNVIELELKRSNSISGTSFPGILNRSYLKNGERTLRHEVVVNATLQQAWEAFTTAEGLKTFVAPTAELELKTGGKFHTNYALGSKVGDPGTIYNQVLAYVPQRMFAIKVNLNDKFPAGPRNAGTLFAVLEFEDLGHERTKVSESMLGWQEGPEWDQVYGFFDMGNAYTLKKLQERFEDGPVDWKNTAKKSKGGIEHAH